MENIFNAERVKRVLMDYQDYSGSEIKKTLDFHLEEALQNKNKLIRETFDGTEGYIIVPILKDISNQERKDILISTLNAFKNNAGDIYNPFIDLVRALIEDEEVVISEKGIITTESKKSYYSGAKLTKVLTQIADISIPMILSQNKMSWMTRESISHRVKDVAIGSSFSKAIKDFSDKGEEKVLILSIRPEDFITMSEGTNWSGCQTPTGGYSSGVMPTMAGGDSVIAFTIDSKDLDGFKSGEIVPKQWRSTQFILPDGSALLSSREYPSEAPSHILSIKKFFFGGEHLETIIGKRGCLTAGFHDLYGYLDAYEDPSSSLISFKEDISDSEFIKKDEVNSDLLVFDFSFQSEKSQCSCCSTETSSGEEMCKSDSIGTCCASWCERCEESSIGDQHRVYSSSIDYMEVCCTCVDYADNIYFSEKEEVYLYTDSRYVEWNKETDDYEFA